MKPLFPTKEISRRDALKGVLIGAAGLALTGRLSLRASAAEQAATAAAPAPAPAPAPAAGAAKSVIQIWLGGGPSHLDTFDPKPDAGNDYCGPFNTIAESNVSGMKINGQLPLLGKQADKYSIIRSMTHGDNGHETAAYVVQTGHRPGRLVYPGFGAVVSLFKGYDHGYTGLVPPYVVLTQPQGRFSESGFLGERYKPFCTGGDPNRNPFTVEGIVAPGITDDRQMKRRDLLHSLDTLGKDIPDSQPLKELDQSESKAYDMMFGDTRKLFDPAQESNQTRDAYGRTTFGQSCMMARRLVEHGVPYVTINNGGWDTHKDNFGIMRRKLPELDKAVATLLQDLSDRKLLDTTIVWCCGEFGRTPKIDWAPPWNGGRGHWGKCFSVLIAGGGFKGGHEVGSSDAKGEDVAERPVYPWDLLRSMYIQLGIDPEGPLPNPRGIEAKVLAIEEGEKSGGILKEIM